MSLFDNLAASLGQAVGDAGKNGGDAGGGFGGMVGNAVEFINQQPGGFNGIVARFHEQGAGDVISSWIGTGENKDIDPAKLRQILGEPAIAALAAKTGIPVDNLSGLLAMVLPGIVDRATPSGTLPEDGKLDAGSVSQSLAGLAGLFGQAK